jgi:hypothetical protein
MMILSCSVLGYLSRFSMIVQPNNLPWLLTVSFYNYDANDNKKSIIKQ